ncbi:hypothetical protein [Streptomyces alanosinicus]|uniref:Uncharacterized protein n=1 Tax=Streptomyces alanosinicus TaxID=68171 RepID=A0A918YN28_9ACTN|nr:hypothetical protein [Streptomyces alanosinicus]GHE08688.1 hypothetical protein GCM10010339_58430 [Streptomyces alanosinicus]
MTTVDQILFGWAERDHEGNAGVRPVAHSGVRTIDRWAKRLQYVWATQDGQGEQPEETASLVHLVFDDEAAVLRKLPSRNPHGRGGATLTHVLVGDPLTIDARLALGLHDWPGWRDREPDGTGAGLAPLDLDDLGQAARPGLAALRERVAEVPDEQLTALLAQVLAEPAEDFSVITRPQLALPTMAALLDIAGPVAGRPWTFASRESTDKGSHQPRVVFLTARPPQSMYINQRRRVDVTEPPADSDTARFAAQLVELYRETGHAALERIRPRHPLRDADDVTLWRRSVPVVDGRIADPRVRLDIFLDDDLLRRAAERDVLMSERMDLVGELRRQPEPWLIAALRRWRSTEQRAVRHRELRDLLLAEAVQACLAGQAGDAVVEATRDAEPEPAVVARVFGRQVPEGGLDLSRPGHRRLLIVALALRMPADALDHTDLLAASPADELLDLVERHAGHYPRAMHLVLRHLGDAGQSPAAARRWYERGLLLDQVDRIAGDDRAKEVDCFRLLLLAAHGPRLDRAAAEALVRHAGVRAPLGLYAAALELAADGAAEQPVRHELSEQFLHDHGYLGPGPGTGHGRYPGGPVPGRPTTYPWPAAPYPAAASSMEGSSQPYPSPPRPSLAGTRAPAHTEWAHTEWAHPTAARETGGGVVPDPSRRDTSAPARRPGWGSPGPATSDGPPPPSDDHVGRFAGLGQLDGVSVFFVTALVLVLLCAVGYVLLTSMP